MLYSISVWTILLIGCYGIGLGLLNGLRAYPVARLGDRAVMAVWLGILALALALLTTGLFLPLSPWVGGGFFLGFLLLALRSKSTRSEVATFYRQISTWQIVIYFGVAIAIAAFVSQPVIWEDTGLYHYSVIRWLAEFGTVPGIALLFANFGFTSAWFAFAAPLNPDVLAARASTVANGLIFLLAVLQFGLSLFRIWHKQSQLTDGWIVICYSCILPIILATDFMSIILISASPDIPALFLVIATAWTILLTETAANETQEYTKNNQTVSLFLAIGAFSIKLTALPLLFVTGLWFIFRYSLNPFNPRWLLHQIAIAALFGLLLVPFFLSGIITSGCPLYPSGAFCLDLPWSPDLETSESIAKSTHGWISWYGTPPEGVSPLAWALGHWFKEFGNKVMVALIVSTIAAAIYLLVGKNRHRVVSRWLIALAVTGIVFFLFTAPFNRFVLPYLFIVPALAISTYLQSSKASEFLGHLKISVPFFATGLVTAAVLFSVLSVRKDYTRFIVPPPLMQIDAVKSKSMMFAIFRHPERTMLGS
ncbi:MAG: LIC_10190 family membrane protein [Leptolyngbya sp. IPPAS B-1204]